MESIECLLSYLLLNSRILDPVHVYGTFPVFVFKLSIINNYFYNNYYKLSIEYINIIKSFGFDVRFLPIPIVDIFLLAYSDRLTEYEEFCLDEYFVPHIIYVFDVSNIPELTDWNSLVLYIDSKLKESEYYELRYEIELKDSNIFLISPGGWVGTDWNEIERHYTWDCWSNCFYLDEYKTSCRTVSSIKSITSWEQNNGNYITVYLKITMSKNEYPFNEYSFEFSETLDKYLLSTAISELLYKRVRDHLSSYLLGDIPYEYLTENIGSILREISHTYHRNLGSWKSMENIFHHPFYGEIKCKCIERLIDYPKLYTQDNLYRPKKFKCFIRGIECISLHKFLEMVRVRKYLQIVRHIQKQICIDK